MPDLENLYQDVIVLELAKLYKLVHELGKRWSGYNGLKLQRAMRSGYDPSGNPTNLSTHTLWNNSTTADYLIVRELRANCSAGGVKTAYTPTLAGAHSGSEAHLLPNHAIGPGQHYFQDTATAITQDFVFAFAGQAQWNGADYPFACLPPGWGLTVQNDTSAQNMRVGFLWEYVPADDLELGN